MSNIGLRNRGVRHGYELKDNERPSLTTRRVEPAELRPGKCSRASTALYGNRFALRYGPLASGILGLGAIFAIGGVSTAPLALGGLCFAAGVFGCRRVINPRIALIDEIEKIIENKIRCRYLSLDFDRETLRQILLKEANMPIDERPMTDLCKSGVNASLFRSLVELYSSSPDGPLKVKLLLELESSEFMKGMLSFVIGTELKDIKDMHIDGLAGLVSFTQTPEFKYVSGTCLEFMRRTDIMSPRVDLERLILKVIFKFKNVDLLKLSIADRSLFYKDDGRSWRSSDSQKEILEVFLKLSEAEVSIVGELGVEALLSYPIESRAKLIQDSFKDPVLAKLKLRLGAENPLLEGIDMSDLRKILERESGAPIKERLMTRLLNLPIDPDFFIELYNLYDAGSARLEKLSLLIEFAEPDFMSKSTLPLRRAYLGRLLSLELGGLKKFVEFARNPELQRVWDSCYNLMPKGSSLSLDLGELILDAIFQLQNVELLDLLLSDECFFGKNKYEWARDPLSYQNARLRGYLRLPENAVSIVKKLGVEHFKCVEAARRVEFIEFVCVNPNIAECAKLVFMDARLRVIALNDSDRERMMLDFTFNTASIEDCLCLVLLDVYKPSKDFILMTNAELVKSRLILSLAKIRLEHLVNPRKNRGNAILDFSRILNDPDTEEWDRLPLIYQSVDDQTWLGLRRRLETVVRRLFPDDQNMLANVLSFFDKTMNSQDAQGGGIESVRQRVATVIECLISISQDPMLSVSLKEKAMERVRSVIVIMGDGGTQCPDRVMVKLTQAENTIKMHSSIREDGRSYVLNVLVNEFKLNAVQSKLVDQNQAENLETYFYYSLLLNEAFNLRVKTRSMLYPRIARLMEVNVAVDKCLEAYTVEDLVGYVARQGDWRALHEDKLTGFQTEKYALIYTISDEGQSTDDIIKTISPEDQKMLLKFFNKESMDELITAAKDEEIFHDMESRWALKAQDLGDIFYERQAKEDLIEAGFLIAIPESLESAQEEESKQDGVEVDGV